MAIENIAANVPDPLKRNLDWYISNQKELSAQYSEKVLLIVDQALIAAFDSLDEAWAQAVKTYEPGTFTLQRCSPDPDSYTLMIFSPGYATSI